MSAFWKGFWSGFSLFPPKVDNSKMFEDIRRKFLDKSDAQIIAEDWAVVGQDLQIAMDQFDKERVDDWDI